jgi:hypothetical protein
MTSLQASALRAESQVGHAAMCTVAFGQEKRPRSQSERRGRLTVGTY